VANAPLQVAAPPAKPLLIYDGDCRFCRRWVERWRTVTGETVDYFPYQEVGGRFPEIPSENYARSVQLILPDGAVYEGAEAVFRGLAMAHRERWLLWLYLKIPAFALLAETIYQEVALHRGSLSRLDRALFGEQVAPPRYIRVRCLFLRGLALIYFVAFLSLSSQIQGLVGSHGIVPLSQTFPKLKAALAERAFGVDRFRAVPTLAWISYSDRSLDWQCRAGMALSVMLFFGIAPAPALFLLWLIYLSLVSIGSPFLDFQWDMLLLETGFLAIFLAPLQWLERPSRQPPPSRLVIWLLRWLIFRLMLESGCVKLMSGDPAWWNLSALTVHFETQPLPTWIGWHAHQLPLGVLHGGVVLLFIIELVAPALIFAGRRPRLAAAWLFVLLQVVILLTGNYTFFNWLTILLCLPLLDDDMLGWLGRLRPSAPVSAALRRWPSLLTLPLTVVIVLLTSLPLLRDMGLPLNGARGLIDLYLLLEPTRSFNGYGLFAVMTRTRPEIILEGSADGHAWQEYEFKDKPGDLKRAPGFVAPFQPRLDWQMWFAALGDVRRNSWMVGLELRLLQNEPAVTALLARNPFANAAPKFVRAQVYEYRFTDRATKRATGAWWTRRFLGTYNPPLSLQNLKGPLNYGE
jgi:predicted DCC family thiol-disulfide oxidoreductase YuxK/uncharacterized membrane protein YphA (DoxX/SURF4 family)